MPQPPAQRALPSDAASLEALDHPAVQQALALIETERQQVAQQALKVRASAAKQRQVQDRGGPSSDLFSVDDNRRRKAALYDLWRQSALLGAATDVIAKRFISGSWSIVPRKDRSGNALQGNVADQLVLLEFFAHCNADEDFNQILYKTVLDLMIFGETYQEVVSKGGIPYELYSCNTIAMDYVPDGYGGVKYYTYRAPFDAKRPKRIPPEGILRLWLPALDNAQRAFAVVEGMVNPLYSDQMMVKTQQKTFENMGSAAQVVYTLPPGSERTQAEALMEYLEEMYSGVLNAGRERVLFGGATANALMLRGLDADFLQGRKESRYEALGRIGVPPAMVSLIESGNLGGGTGESQERSFLQNVLQFYANLVLEKLTYGLIVKRFGVMEWVLDLQFADVVGDPYQEKLKTLDEKRAEQGLGPLPAGRGALTILEVESRAIMEQVQALGLPDATDATDGDDTATADDTAGATDEKSSSPTQGADDHKTATSGTDKNSPTATKEPAKDKQ